MKWFTHKAVAVAGALAVEAPPTALVAILVGSVLPDMVDTTISRGDQKVWRRIHRQASHWFGWYLGLMALGYMIPAQDVLLPLLKSANISFPGVSRSTLSQIEQTGADLLIWVGIGGLVHILLDALTPMRVPLFPFGGKTRFGVNLVSTGTWKESVFLVCAVGLIALQYHQASSVVDQALRQFRMM